MARLTWLLAVLVGLAAAWTGGLAGFTSGFPRAIAEPGATTDVIVVLTGGSERLKEGFRLLAEQKAKKLFISGVYRGVEVEQLLGLSRAAPDNISCCVVLGHAASDTRGNATETARWVLDQGHASIRLVTADYHMPRSLFEFRRTMPQIRIIPHPVFPKSVRRENWWRYLGTSQLYAEEFNKYLIARLWALFDGNSAAKSAAD
ncbi:MAG: YdcF family protein [Alphaproteobacteria bacterium]|nr:YdcF family protein [Alphaproteobacteria bacterium]